MLYPPIQPGCTAAFHHKAGLVSHYRTAHPNSSMAASSPRPKKRSRSSAAANDSSLTTTAATTMTPAVPAPSMPSSSYVPSPYGYCQPVNSFPPPSLPASSSSYQYPPPTAAQPLHQLTASLQHHVCLLPPSSLTATIQQLAGENGGVYTSR